MKNKTYRVSFKGVIYLKCKEEEIDEKILEKFKQNIDGFTLIFEEKN